MSKDIDNSIDELLLPIAELLSGEWGSCYTGMGAFDDPNIPEELDKARQQLKSLILNSQIELLEEMQVIDFSEPDPNELPSMTLDEYLEDKIVTLQKQEKSNG